jgi:small-conductance mechanosensitive channel
MFSLSAMKDIESERLERERLLQEKRENLQAFQFQLNATNNHKNQVENNVARLTDQIYQLRYINNFILLKVTPVNYDISNVVVQCR